MHRKEAFHFYNAWHRFLVVFLYVRWWWWRSCWFWWKKVLQKLFTNAFLHIYSTIYVPRSISRYTTTTGKNRNLNKKEGKKLAITRPAFDTTTFTLQKNLFYLPNVNIHCILIVVVIVHYIYIIHFVNSKFHHFYFLVFTFSHHLLLLLFCILSLKRDTHPSSTTTGYLVRVSGSRRKK